VRALAWLPLSAAVDSEQRSGRLGRAGGVTPFLGLQPSDVVVSDGRFSGEGEVSRQAAAKPDGLIEMRPDLVTRADRDALLHLRQIFGKLIGADRAIGYEIADRATEVAAERAFTRVVARRKMAALPHVTEASQAKLFASCAARNNAEEAIQLLGVCRFSREFPAEKVYRDAKITEIYEGTSEVQRLVIARNLLGLVE
jgi:Acyl-CoA dehydrogenase, C-terminal domain